MRLLRGLGFVVLLTGVALTSGWAGVPPNAVAMPSGTLILPAGTPIRVQLETSISSADARRGDRFAGLVMRSVYVNGRRAIPRGAILEGEVREVMDHRVATGTSALLLRPDFLALPDGRRFHISAQVTEALAAGNVHVGSEGMIEASRGMDANNVHWSEAGTAGGLATGAIVAGAQGALIGTGVGAAVAVGWWLLSHRHATLNQGAELDVTLQRPVALAPNGSSQPAAPGRPRLQRRPIATPRPASAAVGTPQDPKRLVSGPRPLPLPAFQPPPMPTVQNLPAPVAATSH